MIDFFFKDRLGFLAVNYFRYVMFIIRRSHRRCSLKKGVLKNFANFTEKHLGWSLFLNKAAALRHATLLERDSNTGVFL